MNKILPLLLMVCLSTSCETVEITKKKFACSELDWFELGRSDGVQGLSNTSFSEKTKDCEGFTDLEQQKYLSGWYSGLDQYCTSEQGFAFGRQGKKYINVCPEKKERDFLKAYKEGMKVYGFEKENQKISTELEEISATVNKTEIEKASGLYKRMTELETQLELNKAMIAEIQKEIDNNTQSATF